MRDHRGHCVGKLRTPLGSISILAAAHGCLVSVADVRAGVEESQDCSIDKLTALTKEFRCLVKQSRHALAGKSSDNERCHSAVVEVFDSKESGGFCPTVGDAEVAHQIVLDAETNLFSAIEIELADD